MVLYGVLHMGFFLVRWDVSSCVSLCGRKDLLMCSLCPNDLDANLAWHPHPLQSLPCSREVESPAPYRHSWRNGITIEPVSAASISSACPPGLVHGVFILTWQRQTQGVRRPAGGAQHWAALFILCQKLQRETWPP